jgi:hypothetical protein
VVMASMRTRRVVRDRRPKDAFLEGAGALCGDDERCSKSRNFEV